MKSSRQNWANCFIGAVLAACCTIASAQQVTDTFTRADGTDIGAPETPLPGVPYGERNTAAALVNVASIAGGQLYIFGDGSAPAIAATGQAVLAVEAADLSISADLRFDFTDPSTAQASIMAGFLLRKPAVDAGISAAAAAGQIVIDFMPTGGLLIRQKDPTGTTLTTLFNDNPWLAGTQATADLEKFTAAGTLPATVNGLPFDVDGDAKLETTEPFRLGAVLSGTSLQILINGEVIATATVSGTGSTLHNYFALDKNKWTSTTAGYTGCHVYFDNLQVAVNVPNDTCATAKAIGDGLTTGQTLVANASGVASCGSSNGTPDVWYAYTASCTGNLSIDTCGSDFNTVLAVFGACGGTELICNDQCAGTPCTGSSSCLSVPVTQGNTYYIRVSGNNGASGAFNLNLVCGPPPVPANDNCASAVVITADETTTLGTTLGATPDGASLCGNGSPDVWYSWNAPFDSNLTVTTCGTLFNSVVSVYDGCGGAELGCNASCQNPAWCGAPASCLTVPVLGGHPYLIRVSGVGGASGPFKLYLEDEVVIRHVGTTDPTTEGWTKTTTAAIQTTAPDTTIEPAWNMAQGSTGTLYYSKALTATQLRHPDGWTATWRAKVIRADAANQMILQVVDGADIWAIHAIDGTEIGGRAKGVYQQMSDTAVPYLQLGTVDPTDGFHTYQMVYDPASSSVSHHVDGVVLAVQTRAEAVNNTTVRVMFGDNIAGTQTTQQLCSFADFVMRRAPLTPPNDECTGAMVLNDGLTKGVTYGATAGGTASCGTSNSSPDIWYTYTATCTGDLTLDTCGSSIDTVLSVYTGGCASKTEVACNDECGGVPCAGPSSCVTFHVNAGEQFLIRVAGANGVTGAFNIQARCGIPANDACANATPVTEGTIIGSTVRATVDGTASCGNSNSSPDVWYRYSPQSDGLLRLDTCGSAMDTVVSVHSACGGAELACNDDCTGTSCTGPASCLTLPVTANTTYWIRVAAKNGAEGSFQLRVQDSVLLQHLGSKSPVLDEGWTESSAGTFTRGAGSEGMDYWSLSSSAGSRDAYVVTPGAALTIADFQDPSGWTLTATARVLAARDVYEANLLVDDGISDWILNFVVRPNPAEQGVYTRPAGGTPTLADRISGVDPSEGYHTYQIIFDPAGDGGSGMVTYYLDGVAIGTQTRIAAAGAPASVPYRVLWGDNVTGLAGAVFAEPVAASDVKVAFVQFELGQRVHASPPVANELCAAAKAISTGEFYGVTGAGASDGSASCGASNSSPDVWYAYTAASTGNLIVDTCGSVLDTVLSVYNGCGGAQLACNDNTCGLQSRVVVPVTQGNVYLIRVAANGGAAGLFRLHVAAGIPANDTCATAAVVNGGATQGTTLGATADGTASCGSSDGSPDVWYRYTSTCNAPVEVNTCGAAFDTVVSLHSACGGAEVACADDECGQASKVEVSNTTGTIYYIRVSGTNYSQGDFTMNILCKAPPVNDACSSAIVITDGTTAGTTMFATADGDALCGTQGSATSPDVWYLYTATRTGRLKLDASDANFAAILSLHQASCPGGIENQIACAYPILTYNVQEGATYLIRVAGLSNASGSFNLKVGYDTIVIKHEGQNQPVLEGWTRDNNNAAAVEGPSTDTLPFWYLAQSENARLNYQYLGLSPSDFSDPEGWTITAIAKTVVSSGQWQAHLLLQDGQDTWTLHLIDGTGPDSRGVYITDQNFLMLKVSDLDPTANYHQYQIAYNPRSQTAMYIIDGTAVYTQRRDQAYDSTLRRVIWGDNITAGGSSYSQWNLVQFEFGSQAAGCFDPVFDADGDTDVDIDDFGAFQVCYTGQAGGATEECRCFDRDANETIDIADFAKFLDCVSGATIPAAQACDDD